MNVVQPIKSKEKIEEMKEELKKSGTRNYLFFQTGINTGLRISDIVKLKVSDVKDESGFMKSHIQIKEQKTKKEKQFPLCNNLLVEMQKYTRKNEQGDYLLSSIKAIKNSLFNYIKVYIVSILSSDF